MLRAREGEEEVEVDIERNEDGTMSCSFVPKISGQHELEVLYKGESLCTKTISVQPPPSPTSRSEEKESVKDLLVSCQGGQWEGGLVGVEGGVGVRVMMKGEGERGEEGEEGNEREERRGWKLDSARIRAEVVGPGGKTCVNESVQIEEDGNCWVKFTPKEEGDYLLKVYYFIFNFFYLFFDYF